MFMVYGVVADKCQNMVIFINNYRLILQVIYMKVSSESTPK